MAAPGYRGIHGAANGQQTSEISLTQPPSWPAVQPVRAISPAAIRSSVSQSTTNRVTPQTLHAEKRLYLRLARSPGGALVRASGADV